MVGGVVLVLSTRPDAAEFGWFAYTPLSNDPDWTMGWDDSSSSTVIISWWQLVGAAAAVIGLMIVAAGIAFRLGRRRT